MLPFSREVYFYLFGQFNGQYIWVQALAGLVTLLIMAGTLGLIRTPPRALLAGLAGLWATCAWLWFFQVFAPINFLAPVYGYLALAQAIALFAVACLIKQPVSRPPSLLPSVILFLLSLSFPLVDLISGPGWPNLRWPALNVEPLLCLTMGVILQFTPRWRYSFAIIPLLLAVVTTFTAGVLPLRFDWIVLPSILAAGVVALKLKR